MLLNRDNSGKRWHLRPDGVDKVTGQLQYLTDMTLPDMIHGRVLRSSYPYARILSIDITGAEAMEGIFAVLTFKDVPGLNRFGIATPDQPVFARMSYVMSVMLLPRLLQIPRNVQHLLWNQSR